VFLVTLMVSQSNYLPWKGYFDLLRHADRLVLLDNVQFTRRDWRSRNLIKAPDGIQWLSIPVRAPSGRRTSVSEAEISDPAWARSHLRALELSYRRTANFKAVFGLLEKSLLCGDTLLSNLNERILRAMCDFMNLEVDIQVSRGPIDEVDPSERILDLVRRWQGTRYISGPSARAYLNSSIFLDAGVEVVFFDYPTYAEYEQVWPPFRHDVSMVDVLFHLGRDWRSALGTPG
jgi:hypothetical protein